MDLTVKNFMENSIGPERLKGYMNFDSIDLDEMLQIVAASYKCSFVNKMALNRSPESWHMRRCFGLRLKRYHLKKFLFLALVAISFRRTEPSEQYHEEHFCEIILNLDQCFRRICGLKVFYLELWLPLCLAEQNQLCHYARGHY